MAREQAGLVKTIGEQEAHLQEVNKDIKAMCKKLEVLTDVLTQYQLDMDSLGRVAVD